jgi:FdhD protein
MIPRKAAQQVHIQRWEAGQWQNPRDWVAVEAPLEIRLTWETPDGEVMHPLTLTMRTPGEDYALTAGLLFAEGILSHPDQIHSISYCRGGNKLEQDYNQLNVRLRPGVIPNLNHTERRFYSNASCGVCGKTSLENLLSGVAPISYDLQKLDPALLCSLPEQLQTQQRTFARTGGLHASGLFNPQGQLLDLQEDVGRHNALDKLIGTAFLAHRLPLHPHILVLSGRVSFELMQKALRAQIPVIVAVGAPSSLAIEMAQTYGVTLLGFVKPQRCNVYAHPERLQLSP